MKRYKRYFEDEIIDQTKTPEFKKWFGKSKVVKNGKPLIVYHGSTAGFNTFDSKKIGSHTDDGMWGKGFYFSDERTAKKYGANVVGVFLSIKNPYMITGKQTIQEVADYLEIDESILKSDGGFVRPYVPYIGTFTSNIKYKGHDGIIVDRGGVSNEFVVFNANQIKSATENSGEFNKSSNNIYESEFKEDVSIPLNKNDGFYFGKFKNKKAIFDHSYINEKGDLIFVTSTGKEISACKVRLIKESEELNENVKRFSENLRFSDLMKMASLSPFTRDYNKETNKLMGNPTNHTKLKSMKINRKKDYITFVWKTKRTPKYSKNQKMKDVDPNTLELKPAKYYTIEFRVLDFFKWLGTTPNDITNKDIEDVLKVADIQVWDSTPMWQFQGGNYNMSLFDASIHSETRPPKYWNTVVSKFGKTHNENQFLSKHSAGVANSIKFYIPQMRQMVKSYMIKNNMLKSK